MLDTGLFIVMHDLQQAWQVLQEIKNHYNIQLGLDEGAKSGVEKVESSEEEVESSEEEVESSEEEVAVVPNAHQGTRCSVTPFGTLEPLGEHWPSLR